MPTATADTPLLINNPSLGLLNLAGERGEALLLKDFKDLGDLFPKNVTTGKQGQVPKCNVLFLYCSLEPDGRIVGHSVTVRDVIKTAGAHIAVIASDIPPEYFSNPEF